MVHGPLRCVDKHLPFWPQRPCEWSGADHLIKKSLSERDICTKFITPALRKAGWDEMTQIREEVSFTKAETPPVP
jgi:hypothetical protein